MKILINLILTMVLVVGSAVLFKPAHTLAFDPTSDICRKTPSATVCQDAKSGAGKNPLFGKDGIITKAVQMLAILTGVAAVIVIIIGGFRFVESGGNPEKTAKAKSTITYAVVGLVVAALAQAIVVFVLSKL